MAIMMIDLISGSQEMENLKLHGFVLSEYRFPATLTLLSSWLFSNASNSSRPDKDIFS